MNTSRCVISHGSTAGMPSETRAAADSGFCLSDGWPAAPRVWRAQCLSPAPPLCSPLRCIRPPRCPWAEESAGCPRTRRCWCGGGGGSACVCASGTTAVCCWGTGAPRWSGCRGSGVCRFVPGPEDSSRTVALRDGEIIQVNGYRSFSNLICVHN